VPIAPMGPVHRIESTGVGPQVLPEQSGFPCAMGYGLYVLSPVRQRFFVTAFARTLGRISRQTTCH